MGNRAVAVQVAVPLAVFLVMKMLKRIGVDFFKPVPVFLVSGQAVGHQGGDQDLVMHPPQLHIPFQLLAGAVVQVHKVEAAAEFFIPAAFQRPVDDVQAFL